MSSASSDKTKPKPRVKIPKSKQQVPDLEKRTRCMELRLRGYSFRAIGEEMGLSQSRAYELCASAYEEQRRQYQESAGEALQQELNRIERNITLLEAVVFPEDRVPVPEVDEATGKPIPVKLTKVQMDALFMMDKLLDRKAKLLGFYRTDDTKVKEPLPWSDDE